MKKVKSFISFLIIVVLGIFTYLDGLETTPTVTSTSVMLDTTQLYFIDVGQGDSNLILAGDDAILIDGGTNSSADDLVAFLESIGISQIDLIIATHPHEDHIGGLDAVMDNFEVDQILMGDLPYNTKTYEDVITAADTNNVELIYPQDGDFFEFESGIILELLLPSDDFESSDVNDDSIVCRVDIGETSILYTGDMEKALEAELLWQITDVDILKVGHHGSTTSSTQDLLDKSLPEIAVISCGVSNKYGHPNIDVIERLTAMDVEIRRTDLEGTVLIEIE